MRVLILMFMMLAVRAWAQDAMPPAVAGLAPWQRPAGAPTLTQYVRPPQARPLTGVTEPVPPSISAFLKDQGAWFNPFVLPGMTGYYDVRAWHAAANLEAETAGKHLRASHHPLHFKPAASAATDEQCLACHQEVLADKVRTTSQAGVNPADVRAWYQRTSTYQGEQDTFHRRHLTTPLARSLMNLKCNTCHEGADPREKAPGSSARVAREGAAFTLRKTVNPETSCLKCHGQMPAKEIMGLPGPWREAKAMFQNDCLICHQALRTNRHNVSYLNAAAIEAAAEAGKADKTGADVCYGCHGGRPWYRIAYPYARNPWPGMPEETPAWAKGRPTRSEARFLLPGPAR